MIVSGLVTVRQRPQSAKGTVFLLLEDEHGSVQVIVAPRLAEAHREAVRHTMFLAVYGRVERDGPLASVAADRFRPLGGHEAGSGEEESAAGTAMLPSRDFR